MCGICGIYNFGSIDAIDEKLIKKMVSSLTHRGPDDEGYYFNDNLALGFRRLSIIDLSGGHQPMSNDDKSVWVVFNGEIYNFQNIREKLIKIGYKFRTRSDTEVIVHGYKEWGIDVLKKLNGMFGLAIWDDRKKRLIVARDRMGIKLVYYCIKNQSLIFGSEMRAVTAAGISKNNICITALNLFLRYRYTPSPLTIVEDINKLPPGSCLIVENGNVKQERWYNYTPNPCNKNITIEEATEELYHLYNNSVRQHLISDVPVGLLLSGGVDSALLLALMNKNGDNWKTFTVGYGKSFKDDELLDAKKTAQQLGVSNIQINIDRHEFEKSLPKIISCLEEPIASSSIVPMYHVCKKASEFVKVALIGQGPDEMFGGYKRHLGLILSPLFQIVPNNILFVANKLFRYRYEIISRSLYALNDKNRMKKFQKIFSLLPGEDINNLFKDDFKDKCSGDEILDCWNDLIPNINKIDELSAFNYLELQSSLPDELLMYADKLSMAHSIELRVPYLDHNIFEYAMKICQNLKINYLRRKYIHKNVAIRLLPHSIIKRKKRGFAVNVVDQWFRESVQTEMNDILKDPLSYIYNYLNQDIIMNMYKQHQSKKSNYHKVLFSIVCFEYWLRYY